MVWDNLISSAQVRDRHGRVDIDVRGVQYDSRRVSAGDVFVAMRGESTDGNRFVNRALQAGAAAVITDSPEIFDELKRKQPELALALVEHGRRSLATVSAALFQHPEETLRLSAITGTNGKTTTAFLLEQLLRAAGRRSVLIGTIETRIDDQVWPAEHTTPEGRDTLALLAQGVRAGCTEAVMEFSSHALEQGRVWGLPVDVAIFTNLTQDHLDYHGNMAAYARAKMRLFTAEGTGFVPRVAVINGEAAYADDMMLGYTGSGPIMRYAIEDDGEPKHRANYQARDLTVSAWGTHFHFITPSGDVQIASPLVGRINVQNLLAAMCAALARGLPLAEIASAVPRLRPAPGRFEVVAGSKGAGFTVVVDYAHTDDALRNLIALARELVKDSGGRVITLFGCGGDRDRTKRPKMGRAAGEGSDLVIVTSDNPRGEKPEEIIAEVLPGLEETLTAFVVEPDRRAAIDRAIRAARAGDIVLLAGKGHEKVQIFAEGAVLLDDVAEAERVLQLLSGGWREEGRDA